MKDTYLIFLPEGFKLITNLPEKPKQPPSHWTATSRWELYEQKILPKYNEAVQKVIDNGPWVKNEGVAKELMYKGEPAYYSNMNPKSFGLIHGHPYKVDLSEYDVSESFWQVKNSKCRLVVTITKKKGNITSDAGGRLKPSDLFSTVKRERIKKHNKIEIQ